MYQLNPENIACLLLIGFLQLDIFLHI